MADTNGRFLTRLNPCPGTGTFSTSGSNPIMIDTKKVEQIPPLKFDQTIHFLVVFPPKVKIPDQTFVWESWEIYSLSRIPFPNITISLAKTPGQINSQSMKEVIIEKNSKISAICLQILKILFFNFSKKNIVNEKYHTKYLNCLLPIEAQNRHFW